MYGRRNQVVLPLNLETRIKSDDPVFKLAEICDSLDYTELYRAYIRTYRKYDPAMLFMLLVFAYMNGIYSSREIEKACQNDIRFMWILQNSPVPDHATIAHFQNERLSEVMEKLFYQLVVKLSELGEVKFKNVFVDGTKIEANANRYTFVWAKAVQKNMNRLYERIDRELPTVALKYGLSESVELEQAIGYLENFARMCGIEFVHGSGKRKTELQRDCERLTDYQERLEKYREALGICGKRQSYSKTDTDATFMRMKEDHMRNGQLKPGYNVQIAVESEYIVGVGLFPNPTDTLTLIPFLERIQQGSKRKYESITADSGYASEENYTYLEQQGQRAYIKPADHDLRKKKKFKSDIYRVENMHYDEQNDRYICPNGKELKYTYDSHSKTASGYTVTQKNYMCESCADCPCRNECFKGRYENRKIRISQTMARQKEKAERLISSNEGIILRMNRSIQVEGAFGVLKEDYAFRRFLTRGKSKTETQFLLLGFAFNIKKLCNRLNSGRFHMSLFEKMTA